MHLLAVFNSVHVHIHVSVHESLIFVNEYVYRFAVYGYVLAGQQRRPELNNPLVSALNPFLP